MVDWKYRFTEDTSSRNYKELLMHPKTLHCVVLFMTSLGRLATATDIISTWDGSTGGYSNVSIEF